MSTKDSGGLEISASADTAEHFRFETLDKPEGLGIIEIEGRRCTAVSPALC